MRTKNIAISLSGTFLRLIIMLVVVFAIYKAGMEAYDFGYQIFSEGPMSEEPGRDIEVTVTQGKSVMDIGKILEEKGLIRDVRLFWVQEKLSAYKGDLKPGIYTLNTSMTAEEMMAVMAEPREEEGREGSADEEAVSQDLKDATAEPSGEEESGGEQD